MTQMALPSGWTVTRFRDIGIVSGGITKNISRKTDRTLPYLRVANVYANELRLDDVAEIGVTDADVGRAQLEPGDLLIVEGNGSLDQIGRVAIWRGSIKPCVHQNHLIKVRFPDGLSPDFTMFWLLAPGGRAQVSAAASSTSGLHTLSISKIESLALPVAPLGEQQRIVEALDSYLSRLDSAVASLQKVQTKLKAYRASVLKAAVEGRLVPTEAEIARREGRDYEPASVLLARILKERRHRWEEAELARMKKAGKPPKDDAWKKKYEEPEAPDTSKLPSLPEGWCWASVEQACSLVVDCHNKTAPYVEDGIPLLRTSNIRDGQIRWSDLRFVDEPTYEFWSRRCPPAPGDVLFTREAPMGEAAIVPDGSRVCMGQRMMLLRAVGGAVVPSYLLLALLSPPTQALVRQRALGVGVEHLRVGDVEKLTVPVPPLAEQVRIVDAADALLSVEQHAKADTAQCRARVGRLRQSILKWAFEGKLVDQDPRDEPAEELLARIRAEREAAPTTKTRGRKAKSS